MVKVKCWYCKKELDKASDECISIAPRRYAHKMCASIYGIQEDQDAKDKAALEKYICKKFNTETVDPKIQQQMTKYHNELKFSYSGMMKALIYYYDIKKQDIGKSRGGIGILPYIWTEAYNYYHNIYQQQQKNKDFVPHERIDTIIEIDPPKRQEGKRFKLFDLESMINGEDS